MIPKKIHYVWVGDYDNIPDIEKLWRKNTENVLPEYEFKVWTEKDVPSNTFLEQCLDQKIYWAASDYIRTYILNKEGGIYIDTDLEIVKPIPEDWFKSSLILPTETEYHISNYFIGCNKNNSFLQSLLKMYNSYSGSEINPDDWVAPKLWEKHLEKCYGKYNIRFAVDNSFKSGNNIRLLSFTEMCPYYPWDKSRVGQMVDVDNAIGIHYWNNYKKLNNIELDSFGTKYFDNE